MTAFPPTDNANQDQFDQAQRAVYLSGSAGTVALDASTGVERWRIETPLENMAIAGNYLLGTEDLHISTYRDRLQAIQLHCFERATGKHLWAGAEPILIQNWTSRSILLTTPTTVYGMNANHEIVALRLADGATLWRQSYADWDLDQLVAAPGDRIALEVRERDTDKNHKATGAILLGVIRAQDGAQLWAHQRNTEFPFDSDEPLSLMVTDQSSIYHRINEDTLVAYELADGATRWQFLPSASIDSLALAQPDTLAVGSNGYVFALNTTDGALRWRYHVSRRDMYVENYLTGEIILHVRSITLVEDRLLISVNYISGYSSGADPDTSGVLVALSASDGRQLWIGKNGISTRLIMTAPTAPSVIGAISTNVNSDKLEVRNWADGELLWKDKRVIKNAWQIDETLYLLRSREFAVHAGSGGATLWSYPLVTLDPSLSQQPENRWRPNDITAVAG